MTAAAPPKSETRTIALETILPNPYQPRRSFDPQELEDLAASIREVGVLQDILVRRHGRVYELIAGERRVRAARLAGLAEIRAKIRELSDVEVSRIALIENVQRADLNPLDEARAIESHVRVAAEHGEYLTFDDVRKQLGKSLGWLEKKRALLRLPDFMQEVVERNGYVQSSVLEINRLPEVLVEERHALIEEIDKGATYVPIKNKVKALLDQYEEKQQWAKESQTPDKPTRDALKKQSAAAREAKTEATRAMGNLEAWGPRLAPADIPALTHRLRILATRLEQSDEATA